STSYAEGRCGTHPWCDTSLSPEQRATLLLGAMSQSDKIGVLTGKEASDVGMPPIKWTDGAVGAGGLGSGSNPATAMPASMVLAANFDRAPARSYGAVVGQEVKHRGFDGDWGPTVNIMRTPLGGRTFEAYGEDPFLSGQTAVGWIDGFQAQGVMADVKHFAANNQEGQYGVSPIFGVYGSRPFVNVHVDPRALHEIELTPFEAAITQGHSATVMCSYNLLEGQYACANPFLLKDTFRGLFGSDGFVVSDFLACHETEDDLNAGLNFDIGPSCYNASQVEAALADGSVTQAALEARVYEILRKLFAFGFFDHPSWPNEPAQDDRVADTAVADRSEEGGAVLLRNRRLLPINPRKVRSIAVIGPAADQYVHGNGSSQVTPHVTTTPLAGITARAAQAGIAISYDDGKSVESAQGLAKSSDLAIVDADPGGRLPATFPKSEADLPTAPGGMAQYPGTVNPEENCRVHMSVPCPYYQEYYSEGVLEGYRWYDKQRIEPAFPFGFGLSYTRFRFSELALTAGAGPEPSATG